MMTFADLSSTNKGSSFKGPALKDVKGASKSSSNSSTFQTSQKARDWSSLEQSLQSVFTIQQSPAQVQDQDGWGDFQDTFKPKNDIEDDDFADFVGPNAIGSRLASFQEESPVHKFKAKPVESPMNLFPTPPSQVLPIPDQKEVVDEDDDFGDFAAPVQAAPVQVASVQAAPIQVAPVTNVTSNPISNDMFSTLTNQGSVFKTSFDDIKPDPLFKTSTTALPSQTPQVTLETFANFNAYKKEDMTLTPTFQVAPNDKYSALRDLLDIDEPINSDPPSILPMNANVVDDDFGDFVVSEAPKSLLPDEAAVAQAAKIDIPKAQTKESPSSVIPWFENSPPPPPIDIPEDTIEEVNTQGFITDDSFMTTNNQDILEQEPEQKSLEQEIASLNLCSIPIETKVENEALSGPVKVVIDQEIVLKITNAIHEMLKVSADIFTNVDDPTVKNEVLTAPETEKFIWNLVQVFRVYKRVKTAYEESDIKVEAIESLHENIEKVWRSILKALASKPALIPDNALYDFSDSVLSSSNYCGICHLNLSKSASKGTSDHLIDSIILHNDNSYHSICINFWMNCVDQSLPSSIMS